MKKKPRKHRLQGVEDNVEVRGGCRGCWYGRLVVSWMCKGGVVGLCCQSI